MSDAPIDPDSSGAEVVSGVSSSAAVPTRTSWLPSDNPLDQKLELVIWASHSKASAAALELQMVDQFRRLWQSEKGLIDTDVDHPLYRSMVLELSAAMNLPKATINRRLATASILIEDMPATFSAMRGGGISEGHVRTMISYLSSLPAEERARLEEKLLPDAKRLTPTKFETLVRREVELREPESMEQRHEEAMRDRNVWVTPERDGMAVLSSRMAAIDAFAAEDLIRAQARVLRTKGGDDEDRSIGQIRSDVLRDTLLDGEAELSATTEFGEQREVKRPARGIVPTVAVTVPVLALLQLAKGGTAITPAMLEGYGPIVPSMAAKIVGAASGFTRILTNPHTGAPISVGTDRYRPPAEMRATIIRLDGTCRAVGCNRPAKECDLDHSVPASQSGPTSLDNVAALCPNDHEIKHNGEWTMTRGENRRVYWVSPVGRVYYTDPEYNVPLEDPETTLTCIDPGWLLDEVGNRTVADPSYIPWLDDDDPEVGLTDD